MSFRVIAAITAAILFILGVGYLVAGPVVVARWQIQPTDAVLLFGRRIGALYIGLSVMFFLARTVPVSIGRTALSTGAVVVCSLLALLGVYEFLGGRSGVGILVSAAIEAFLAVAYGFILFMDRRAASHPPDVSQAQVG
jgi:hypothetical protein